MMRATDDRRQAWEPHCPSTRPSSSSGPWGLGANVAVLKGAANGDDAIIVVNSVIARDVSANALLQESWERAYRELQ